MSKWHPNSDKHKALHGGYKKKPTRSEVNALLSLYASLNGKEMRAPVNKKEIGKQLKFPF